ncbi:hypothetical protein Q5H93_04790 [Hymenobacter sp. ASUV-10]|uniref:Lipocalin-like domain-containing protein n=1 Tax=Hymenobacter aranciens TaxID=3063996 RepID=A0ABT9B6Z1_9BACT|nr:hypothetical protein [Hymenobacter sp. ASUV-10]MDO7874039.1 hypothetical protein [Hymenobacter sp. ASUV-10]
MKALLPILASLAVLTANCSKSKSDDPNPTVYISGSGLPGNWKLVNLQCYCAPAPLANEQLAITSADFAEYRNGTQIFDATYTIGSTTRCGLPSIVPALILVPKMNYSAVRSVGYTLHNDTLVLDYGSACDAPRKSYRRVR